MMAVIVAAIGAATVSGLNMLRGADAQPLRYVIAAMCGVLGWLGAGLSPFAALAQAAGVLVFFLQPWGRWYSLNRGEREWAGPASSYERTIERIGGTSDHACWLISATLFSAPLVVLLGPAWLAPPFILIGSYEIAARLALPSHRMRTGEGIFGAVLGFMSALPKIGAGALVLLGLAACAKPREPWADYSRAVGHIIKDEPR